MNHPITSASNLHRRKSCPGSEALELFCAPEPESAEASEGTMLHAKLSRKGPWIVASDVTDEQNYCVQFCLNERQRLRNELLTQENALIVGAELFETTLLLDGKEFGHADYLAFNNTTALVIDYKFGRIPVDAAEANMQLRAYAVMVHLTHGVEKVYAAIIQPRLKAEQRITLVCYDLEELKWAEIQVRSILSATQKPNAELKSSEDGCRYCRAKAICPALNKQSNEIEKVTTGEITTRNAAELYSKAKIVEKHVDAIKSAIFLLVKESEEKGMPVEGLTLKSGSKRRIINDASKAYGCLSGILTPETFASCCTVKVSDLDEAYKTATGSSLKAAKQALESLLTQEGCLEVKTSEPSLTLTK